MSRLSKYHPSVYFDKMGKYDKKVYLDEYNNKKMKTNTNIKFSSIDEYREIEQKLIELGYRCIMDIEHEDKNDYCSFMSIDIFSKKFRFGKFPLNFNNIYNSLEEFLKHEKNTHK